MKKTIAVLGLMLFCFAPAVRAELVYDDEDDLFVDGFESEDAGKCLGEGCPCQENDTECHDNEYCDLETKRCTLGCRSDSGCTPEQICQNHVCVDLCADNTSSTGELCAGTTPNCYVEDKGHTWYCGCSDTSCYDGMKCENVNGRRDCVPCPEGERCSCMTGYKSDGTGVCIPCPPGEDCGCGDLKSNGDGKCVTCNTSEDCRFGLFCENPERADSKCVPLTCADGEFVDNHQCASCASVLENCTACTNKSVCTACAEGFGVKDGKCATCAEATGDAKCAACNGGECTKCATGFTLQDGVCTPILCTRGTYLSGNDCLDCPEGCAQCESDKVCTACLSGFETNGDLCQPIVCEGASYLRDSLCIACLPNCEACTNGFSCDKCATGYFFDAEKEACLLRVCQKNEYKGEQDGECHPCLTENCINCNETMCFGCAVGYTLQNQTCVPEKCPDGCKSCSSPDTCDKCMTGYESVSGVCEAVGCPAGQYLAGNVCRPCKKGCAECTGANTCLYCTDNRYFLSHDRCRLCSAALSDCETCANAQTCLTCKKGKRLENGQCV